jgi:hypothetical protein
MKSVCRFILFFSVLAITGFFTSCEPDDTFGDDPNDPRNDYVGIWRFTEGKIKKDGLAQSYIVTISLDENNTSQVILSNFCNPGNADTKATGIVTTNQIVVSTQTLSNGWVVSGSGELISSTEMQWSYSITAGGDIEYYTASAVKQ